MAKRKAGLHKEVTSIFDGVPLGDKKPGSQRPAPSVPQQKQQGIPKPAAVQRPSVPEIAQQTPKSTREYSAPTKPQQAERPMSQTPQPEKPKVAPTAANIATSTWYQKLGKITAKLVPASINTGNTRQKATLVLVPILFIVLIVVFIRVIAPPVRGTQPLNPQNPANVAVASGTNIEWEIPEPYPTTLRDPMKKLKAVVTPTTTTPDTTGEFLVKGTIWDDENPLAIINGQILGVGEKIDGATIVEINKDNVVFEKDGKTWTQTVQ